MNSKFNSVTDILNIAARAPKPMDYTSVQPLAKNFIDGYIAGNGFKKQNQQDSEEFLPDNVNQPSQKPVNLSKEERLIGMMKQDGLSTQQIYSALYPSLSKQFNQQGAMGRYPVKSQPQTGETQTYGTQSVPYNSTVQSSYAPFSGKPLIQSGGTSLGLTQNDYESNLVKQTDFGGFSPIGAGQSAQSSDMSGFASLALGAADNLSPDQRQARLLYETPQSSFF